MEKNVRSEFSPQNKTRSGEYLVAHSPLDLGQAFGDLGCECARGVLVVPANLLAEQRAEVRDADGGGLVLARFHPRGDLDVAHDEGDAAQANHDLDQPRHVAHQAARVRRAELVDDVSEQDNPLKMAVVCE